jgi:hypothetical protein
VIDAVGGEGDGVGVGAVEEALIDLADVFFLHRQIFGGQLAAEGEEFLEVAARKADGVVDVVGDRVPLADQHFASALFAELGADHDLARHQPLVGRIGVVLFADFVE